jgi:tetratricopeptide (TPR) repeat protein
MKIDHDNSQAAQLLTQAIDASGRNQSVEACELFYQCIALAPDWGVPHFLVGAEHAAAGEIDKAELGFANAVLLMPNMPVARYQLGLIQFTSGRASLAIISWQPLLDLPDTNYLLYFVRGYIALAQDDFDLALKSYQTGLNIPTDNPPLFEDVRRLIDQINATRGAHISANLGEIVNGDQSDASKEHHVLISNYLTNSSN